MTERGEILRRTDGASGTPNVLLNDHFCSLQQGNDPYTPTEIDTIFDARPVPTDTFFDGITALGAIEDLFTQPAFADIPLAGSGAASVSGAPTSGSTGSPSADPTAPKPLPLALRAAPPRPASPFDAAARAISEKAVGEEDGAAVEIASDESLLYNCGDELADGVNATGGVDCRPPFVQATPDMPSDWRVHHTLQARLRERFRKELGIPVDDLTYLRGVDPELHEQINQCQRDFWASMMKKYECKSLPEVFEKVKLTDVLAHTQAMEEQYGKLWLKAGGRADDVANIRKALKGVDLSPAARKTASANVLRRTGKVLAVLGIVGAAANSAALAKGIMWPSSEQERAFGNLMQNYSFAMDEKARLGYVTQRRLQFTHEALQRYFRALGVSDTMKGLTALKLELEISGH